MSTERSKSLLITVFSFFLFVQNIGAQNAFTVYNTQNSQLPFDAVNCIAFDSTGLVWIGTEYGLASFDGANWNIYHTTNSGLPDNAIRSLAIDRHNNKWIGTFLGGLVKFDGTSWTVFNTQNSDLPDNFIKAIAFDTSGNKWIGTLAGLVQFDDTSWIVYDMSNSPFEISDNIACIDIDTSNFMRIGTLNGGLVHIHNGNWTVFTIPNGSGIPDNTILDIDVDDNGVEWLATPANGLVAHPGGFTWLIYSPFTSMMPSFSTVSLALSAIQPGVIWIATLDVGIVRKSGITFTAFNPSTSDFPDFVATCIERDANGILWIGTPSSGLVRLDESLLTSSGQVHFSHCIIVNSMVSRWLVVISEKRIEFLSLFSLSGQRVPITFKLTGKRAEADLSSLTDGFYLLRLIDETGHHYTTKILKTEQ